MYTYDVVSESIRNPHELAAELTRRSEQGWEVVQVVYDGATWFHAIIRHEGRVGVAPYPGASAPKSLGSDSSSEITTQPSTATVTPAVTATVSAPEATTAQTDTPSVESDTPTTAGDTAAAESSVPEVPANWYKDPSGRFELRYWNGTAWTEHVATGGRQSVDPPKA
jgi:hypothetical protein